MDLVGFEIVAGERRELARTFEGHAVAGGAFLFIESEAARGLRLRVDAIPYGGWRLGEGGYSYGKYQKSRMDRRQRLSHIIGRRESGHNRQPCR